MPVFEYKALDPKGRNIKGIIDAESASAARQKLRVAKNFPVSIKEVLETQIKKDTEVFLQLRFFTRVKTSDISMMTRQLSTLVGAGFPLVSAIDTLIRPTKSHGLNRVLARIKDAIVEGNSFADALSFYPHIFPPFYVNMVRAGESSGTLEIILERLADISEKQQALNNRIRTALAYPVLMAFIGVVVLFLLMTFIVPGITTIFTDMNQVLPPSTRFLIASSNFFKSFWWAILVVIGGMIFTFRGIRKTPKGQSMVDKTTLALPGIGPLVKKLAVARFARTLGSLLENGVTMLASLEIVENIVGNVLISKAIEEASTEVGKGKGLGNALEETKTLPFLAIQMIQVGEQSGELESMLNKIADVYENEVESSIMQMTSLLEPVMILVMGLIVGFIVLSICLPIFEMNQLIK